MLRHTLIAITLITLSCGAFGFRAHAVATQDAEKVRFGVLDIAVQIPDGAELGAYQIDLTPLPDLPTRVRVVGIEGGEHDAFRTPPFYDPEAIGSERVILAAYSTAAELPTGMSRIARVHYEITGEGDLPAPVQLINIREALATDREGNAFEIPFILSSSQGLQP
jgi:hypothetical protein